MNGDDREQMSKIINSKRCELWPECSCRSILLHWQDKLTDEDLVLKFEEIKWADTVIFLALSCVAAHCPDRKIKSYATLQLLSPWWDRQKRGEELTEEFVEQRQRRRAQQ